MEPKEWEVELVEISYPKGYKKRFGHNTIRLDSQDVIFPVKHYESLFHLTNIPHLLEPSKNETFMRIFNEYLYKYAEEPSKQLFNSCYGKNSVRIDIDVSHFPARVYNGLEDLAETIMKPTNCDTSKITVSVKDDPDFTTLKPVYVYTDFIKPNLAGDSYVKRLRTLHFPLSTGYHKFD